MAMAMTRLHNGSSSLIVLAWVSTLCWSSTSTFSTAFVPPIPVVPKPMLNGFTGYKVQKAKLPSKLERQQRLHSTWPFETSTQAHATNSETGEIVMPIPLEGEGTYTDTPKTSKSSVDAAAYFEIPAHSDPKVQTILAGTARTLHNIHHRRTVALYNPMETQSYGSANSVGGVSEAKGASPYDAIFANSYVDLGKIDTVGFDYDYTLVTYTDELLDLIYDKALERLVRDRYYPQVLTKSGLKFDPFFSIRGLAVDRETGWVCHLSYTHKAAVAWEGREKVPTSRILREYSGMRALNPKERSHRLRPLNDLFSMAECCLIADVIQCFKDSKIDYLPSSVVEDVLAAIRDTHLSGDFHRIVAQQPEKYFIPTPHLRSVLTKLKESGKRLIFASNSPFWYVNEGMKYVLGEDWIDMWDTVIVSAGKPAFYTEEKRRFREINKDNGRVMFKEVDQLRPGAVYAEGCLRELTRLMHFRSSTDANADGEVGAVNLGTSSVLYIGDSLFADLVDAKRDFGWKTAAVTPEVRYEMEVQHKPEYRLVERTIKVLLNTLRLVQKQMGPGWRTQQDNKVLDSLEHLVSRWRDRETSLLGNPFGSVFRARYQPSLFAHSLRRYCDLYMASVGSLRLYSPQHRFYPEEGFRLLAHEIRSDGMEGFDYMI
eukprot:Nitzschia sp. Nitz4//scaffold123_size70294//65611//67723//NITZ4_005935-RA/size70294-augustus-gene-0.66-mRNA-1//-1//CDS//3329534506//1685//frame0